MTELKPADRFWNEVVPQCAKNFKWGENLVTSSKIELQKSLKSVVKNLDEAEFDVFTAQLVIKASGMGVVGAELTEIVTWFQELRA